MSRARPTTVAGEEAAFHGYSPLPLVSLHLCDLYQRTNSHFVGVTVALMVTTYFFILSPYDMP
jgi:hypothetical protein